MITRKGSKDCSKRVRYGRPQAYDLFNRLFSNSVGEEGPEITYSGTAVKLKKIHPIKFLATTGF